MCSAVRIKRSPLSPPPVYVADNQTGFVSSTARVSLCVCVCVVVAVCRVVVFSCVRIVRLYNIIVVVVVATALSPLTHTLSPSVSFFFPPQLTPAPLLSLIVFTACVVLTLFSYLIIHSRLSHNIILLLV